MKKLIIRLTGAMALAITLILTGTGPLCAQRVQHAEATIPFDRIYQQSLRAMQNEARAVGLRIDTDIDVVIKGSSHMLLASIEGFENLVLEEGLNELDLGFVGVAGIKDLPDGYYRMHYVVDLEHPEDAVVLLINSGGEVFSFPIVVMEDPDPDSVPRKRLTTEGVTLESNYYVYSQPGFRRQCLGLLTDRTGL